MAFTGASSGVAVVTECIIAKRSAIKTPISRFASMTLPLDVSMWVPKADTSRVRQR